MPQRLYNTFNRQLELFRPRDPSHITFYSCGPTVYDDQHVGNFRSFLAADVLRRWLQSPLCELTSPDGSAHRAPGGRRVTHVMNITDVGHMTDDAEGGEAGEDRMAVAGRRIEEAKKSGKLPPGAQGINPRDPRAIADFFAERFKEDARRLGLLVAIEAEKDPTLMPRPTQKIEGMIRMIQVLIRRGHAYAVGEPGRQTVYFDVQSFPTYGRLSNNTLDKLRSGEGGRVSEVNQSQKKHPADFLLWKADPSHIMKWDSPWGAGYPGWHIECSVMAAERLGAGAFADAGAGKPAGSPVLLPDGAALIDLHSGGEDNIFPHHECEIAQSCCAFNAEPAQGSYARMWFHPRHLFIDGAKMSKSKGNFYTARDLFARNIEPAAIRLEIIRTHYRSNSNFTMQGIEDSQRIVDRWRRIQAAAPPGALGAIADTASPVLAAFAEAMHNDLNVAEAIGQVNRWVSEISAPTAADAAVMNTIDQVLGVLSLERPKSTETSIGVFVGGLSPDPDVEAKLHERAAARAGKDFKRSDQIRDELSARGYAIKDVAGGKVEVSRK